MVPLDRALVSSYKLSIVTMSLSAAFGHNLQCKYFREIVEVYVVVEVM